MKRYLVLLPLFFVYFMITGWWKDQKALVDSPFYTTLKPMSPLMTPQVKTMDVKMGNINFNKRAMYAYWVHGVRECDCITNGHGRQSKPFTLDISVLGDVSFGYKLPSDKNFINKSSVDVRYAVDVYRNCLHSEPNYKEQDATCVLITKGYLTKYPQRQNAGMYFMDSIGPVK